MIETFATIILMSWIILLSLCGVFLIYKQTEFEKPHRVFTAALLVRIVMYIISVVFVVYNYIQGESEGINGVLSVRKLITTFVFYLAFLAFPISVIHQGNIPMRRIISFITPAVVVAVGYFVLCSSLGVSPFERYASLMDVWCDRANPVVVGRMVVFVVFSAYVVYMLYYIWRVEPIYTRYIKQTQSNERFNLSWMKGYSVCVSVSYLANVSMLMYVSPYSIPIYLAVACVLYISMIYYVVSCNSFASLDGLKIRFTPLNPIVVIDDCCCKRRDAADQFALIEEWLNKMKPYSSSNFSLSDVIAEFPTLRSGDIYEILMERGFRFQSYIRECRINYAVELIEKSNGDLLFKELYNKVGFDNQSSFSRAFKAVKGVSPADYRCRVNGEK